MGSQQAFTLDSIFLFGALRLEPDACSPRFTEPPPPFLILSSPSPQPVVTVVTKNCEALLKQEVVGPQGVGSGVTCGVLVPWEPVWTGAPPFTAGDEAGWMGHQQSSAGPAPGDPSPRPALPSAGGVRPPALWGAVQDPAPPRPRQPPLFLPVTRVASCP